MLYQFKISSAVSDYTHFLKPLPTSSIFKSLLIWLALVKPPYRKKKATFYIIITASPLVPLPPIHLTCHHQVTRPKVTISSWYFSAQNPSPAPRLASSITQSSSGDIPQAKPYILSPPDMHLHLTSLLEMDGSHYLWGPDPQLELFSCV